MVNTEIIVIKAENQFKSKALNTATNGIKKAYDSMENGKKIVCSILAKVEKNKSYKEDGFASLADYCEAIGIKKPLVHKMENAGRLLISENPTVREFADKVDFSKLAIISSADTDTVVKAIEDGSLKPEMKQTEFSDWKAKANAEKAKDEDKPLPQFKIEGFYVTAKGEYERVNFEKQTIEALMMLYCPGGNAMSNIKNHVIKDNEGKVIHKVTVALFPDGSMLAYSANKLKAEKQSVPVTKSVKKMTAAELRALLEEAEAREAEEAEEAEEE